MAERILRDPTVEVYFGDTGSAVWFIGSEVEAAAELIEKRFGEPDALSDLSYPDVDIPVVVVNLEDGSSRSWLPGSEVDAISEMLVNRFGDPDGVA